MKRLIAEFEEQSFTQIIFPHEKTDWKPYLEAARENFVNIVEHIIKYQKCLVICDNLQNTLKYFKSHKNLFFVEYETDDTWARDISAISIEEQSKTKLLNFGFNGWGGKFDSYKDDMMNLEIKQYYKSSMQSIDFILEGGAIDSNGDGILLTTSKCMFNKNRHKTLTKLEINKQLKKYFELKDILYLQNGYLAGDDTDSHIDTLARFVDRKSIMYVSCTKKDDEHYEELKLMEDELKVLSFMHGFKLISLPMPDAIYEDKYRLPATYANFLFVNGAVLVPIYGVKQDIDALKIFKNFFKSRDVIPIDCSTLIRQHGSLHCVTMNFAKGIELKGVIENKMVRSERFELSHP